MHYDIAILRAILRLSREQRPTPPSAIAAVSGLGRHYAKAALEHLEEAIKLSPYISNVMVHGANKPYNVAVVTLDPEAIKKWADAGGPCP